MSRFASSDLQESQLPLDNGLKKISHILVAEFLLANSDASRLASESMLAEAEAMLAAIVADISRLPDIEVTVLLSAEATARLAELQIFGTSAGLDCVVLQRGELQPETLSIFLSGQADRVPFDAMLLIAPECDGVLLSLLKAVQESTASPLLSLNLDWRRAETFSDKHMTDLWLRQHGIPTIPTKTIDDTSATAFRRLSEHHPVAGDQNFVLKPRDGAGADGVRIMRLNGRLFEDLPQQSSDNDRWVLQPLVTGVACSVGFIGGGNRGPTTILPPARQNIQVHDGDVSYHGGQVPCEPALASRISPVADQIAIALGAFNGYLGADLLVNLSTPEEREGSVRVVEINPRLCTSYVGYRVLHGRQSGGVDAATTQWNRNPLDAGRCHVFCKWRNIFWCIIHDHGSHNQHVRAADDPHSRCADSQSAKYRRGSSVRQTDCDDGRQWIRQEFTRLRYSFRGRSAPVSGKHFGSDAHAAASIAASGCR